MKKILLIIPAYNEEENILRVANEIREYAALQKDADYTVDYVVINDGSGDRTLQICRDNGINVINLIRNLGIGGAVQTGYKLALIKNYDAAVQFDGDGQHDLASLDALVSPVLDGDADFTVGSRFVGDVSTFKSTAMRRFGIRFLSGVVHLFGKVRVLDCTSGYRAAGRSALEYLSHDYPFDYPEPESLVHLAKRGFRIREIPVNMLEREGGQSSISSWKSVYYMVKVTLAIIVAGFQRGGAR